ncbi:hypothetical protein LA080_001563 [Diaporthe eres]|uniref:O-methyltransferase domain-containing protein n=1 Tax=Diaporthe vaccinii TaxID=105482 RepID=A0ABR4E1D8_9PEZI|nr:hypothetical protein LA080_001563 [Diaporthe eres]
MASKQDIDTLLERLYKVASQSDEARSELLDSLQSLQLRLETPEDLNLRFVNLQIQLTGAQIAEDLKLFQILAESTHPLTVDELSSKTGVEASLLRRILRYLASVDQNQETSQDTFAANKTTETLARPEYGGPIYHSFHSVGGLLQVFPQVLASAGYRDVEQVPHTAVRKAFSTDLTGFEWLRANPRQFKAFQQAMSVNPQARVPWFTVFPLEAELGAFLKESSATAFVDIGGGFGHQCAALASAFPSLKGRLVLQDMTHTLAIAPPLDGVEAMAHDFFGAQPVQGARFYYLRNVLHDWPREKAVAILSRVREAMGPRSQVLVDEIVLPTSGAHWHATCMDMVMMTSVGARERTVDEWGELLDDAGLRIVKIHTYLPRHQDSIIQAVAK